MRKNRICKDRYKVLAMKSMVVTVSTFGLFSLVFAAPDSSELALVEAQVHQCESKTVQPHLNYPAVLKSRQKGRIASEVEGHVLNLRTNLGQKVERGEVILEIKNLNLGYEYNNYRLRSPVSGVVSQVFVKEGQLVSKNEAVVEIVDLNQLQLEIEVPSDEAGSLRPGLQASIRFGNNQEVKAKIEAISPIANPATGTVTTLLKPTSTLPRGLALGTVGQAEVKLPAREGITVPLSAIVHKNRKPHVRKLSEGDIVQWVPVSLGPLIDTDQVVREGLKVDDEVVVRANDFLKDGDKIRRSSAKQETL